MQIAHIALYVTDLERAKSFFERYLGARAGAGYHNVKTGFRSCFLSFDGGARLELMNTPRTAARGGGRKDAGYAHRAFSLGSRKAVEELTERLRRDGWEVLSGPRTTGDGCFESCVAAVEGNLIELTV